MTLRNKFTALVEVDEDEDVDICGSTTRASFDTRREVLGYLETTRSWSGPVMIHERGVTPGEK